MKSFSTIYDTYKKNKLFEEIYLAENVLNKIGNAVSNVVSGGNNSGDNSSDNSSGGGNSDSSGGSGSSGGSSGGGSSGNAEADAFLNMISSLLGGSGDWDGPGGMPSPGAAGPNIQPKPINSIEAYRNDVMQKDGVAWSTAPGYGNQCVALWRDYTVRVLGEEEPMESVGSAKNIWHYYPNAPVMQKIYDKIDYNKTKELPKPGDVFVTGPTSNNEHGHVGIVVAQNPNSGEGITEQSFPVFEQNVTPQKPGSRTLPYTNVLGFLRPKKGVPGQGGGGNNRNQQNNNNNNNNNNSGGNVRGAINNLINR